jgi:outer membrane lipoprotein carrier protein
MRYSIACVLTSLLWWQVARAEPAKPASDAPGAAESVRTIESLAQLLARFSSIKGMTARYREEKRIALLKRPLVSEGQVYFAAPDLLLQRVEKPEAATVLLEGHALRVADASGARSIDLQSSPLLRHFVLTFVYVLAGDHHALAQLYDLRFSRSGPLAWRLELTPKQPDLGRFVKRAILEGQDGRVVSMTLDDASGDTTTLRFYEVDLDVRYDAAARSRLFRLPAR